MARSGVARLLTNDELIAAIREKCANAAELREYARRVAKKSKPSQCERGHKFCALGQLGPCSGVRDFDW